MDLLSILVELEGWHSFDATCLCCLLVVVNINLNKCCKVLTSACMLIILWGDHLAGRAPRGSEVNHDKLRIFECLIKLCLSCKVFGHLCRFVFVLIKFPM